jgi:hypothetical protein
MNIFKKLVFMVDTLVYLVFCCVENMTNVFPMLVSRFIDIGGGGGICYFSVLFFAQAVVVFIRKVSDIKYLRKPAADEIRNLFSQI